MYIYKDFWRFWKDTSFPIYNSDYWNTWMIHSLVFIIAIPAIFINVEYLYWYVVGVYFIIAFIPNITMSMRRLETNGVNKNTIYWLLLPIIGLLIVIVRMSFDPDEEVNMKSMRKSSREVQNDPSKNFTKNNSDVNRVTNRKVMNKLGK